MNVMKPLFVVFLVLQATRPSLDSPSPKERQAAIEEMAVLGNRDAIPALAEALKKEPRRDIRASIVAAFGRIRDRAAIPALSESLASDFEKEVRLQAIDSILRLYIPIEDVGRMQTLFNRVKSVFAEADRPLVSAAADVDIPAKDALVRAMQRDFDAGVRAQAARALASLKAEDRMQDLVAALEDPQNRDAAAVRKEAVESLGLLRKREAGRALVKALRDPDRQVVVEAVLALGLISFGEARPQLEEWFRTANRSPRLRQAALQAVALMADPGAAPFLESLLADKNGKYRELAAEGLGRLGRSSGFEERMKTEKEANVRVAMAFGLAGSGRNEFINDLASALDGREARQAETYLYELGREPTRLTEIYRYLQSPNAKIRAGILRVIGNIGDPSSLRYVDPLTRDPDTAVARAAVGAMRKLGRPQ